MAFFRRILAALCTLALVCTLAVPASAAPPPAAEELIQQMLNYYCHYQSQGKMDIWRLLEELRQTDPTQAELWEGIFRYWFYALEEMPKNETQLPDDLPQDDSLCIVVLGYALTPYGGIMPELEGRLELALSAAEKYPNAYILCCGGGTASQAKEVTEAKQMSYWLRNRGVDSQRIIVETRSVHTIENADFGIDILRSRYPQIRQLAIVTSDYHLLRSCTLFFAKLAHTALEEGTEAMPIVACLGYEAGHEGFSEDPLDQVAHVARLCGFEYRKDDALPLSRLTDIQVECETLLEPGMIPAMTVTAHYDTGYAREVTGECRISGYDPENPRTQFLTVTYGERGVQIQAVVEIRRPVSIPDPTEAPVTEPLPTPASGAEAESSDAAYWLLLFGLAALAAVLALLRKKK